MPGELAHRSVLVVGLGRFGGGIGVTRWLCAQGARVVVSDAAPAEVLKDSIRQLDGLPVELHLGEHRQSDLGDVDLAVLSPAIDRRRSAFFAEIQSRGIPCTTEIDLFLQRCPARVIGVTGTAGKSTTCALLYEILKDQMPGGGTAWFGGNVGRCLLGELPQMSERDVVVLELSSFQLETLDSGYRGPHIAAITNLRPNHLDRHGTFDAYAAAKLNILRSQRATDTAVLGCDDEPLGSMAKRVVGISGGGLHLVPSGGERIPLRIPGAHNQCNAECAAFIASLLGVPRRVALARMADFGGLPHRLQHAGCIEGLDFYNDSKSTTPQGTATALAAFGRPVILIVGGQERGDDLSPLLSVWPGPARAAFCMGANGDRLADALTSASRAANAVERVTNLDEAVGLAMRLGRAGEAVLLSPGAPSYGDFVNYEHRGQRFLELIEEHSSRQELP